MSGFSQKSCFVNHSSLLSADTIVTTSAAISQQDNCNLGTAWPGAIKTQYSWNINIEYKMLSGS